MSKEVEEANKSKDYISAEEGDIPLYYPKQALPNIAAQTVYNKTRQHLK